MHNIQEQIQKELGKNVWFLEKENTIYYRDVNLFEEIIEFIKRNNLVVNLQMNLL